MAHSVQQSCVRRKNIKRVANHHECLVGGELSCHVVNQRVMTFNNPDGVVDAALALHAHSLQRSGGDQRHGRPGCDSCQLLDQPTEERVARARERSELEVIEVAARAHYLALVKEAEVAIPYPLILLEQRLILALQDLH